jgi:hypothetical protein
MNLNILASLNGYEKSSNIYKTNDQLFLGFYKKDDQLYDVFLDNKDNNNVYYFDSFGQPPPEIIQNILPFNSKINYNNNQIQGLNQNHCGEFDLLFLKYFQSSSSDVV